MAGYSNKETEEGVGLLSGGDRKNDTLVFVVPHKIGKVRYDILKSASEKNKICTTKTFSSHVTHVVTECSSKAQLFRLMKWTEGSPLYRSARYLKLSWLTDSIKNKSPVEIVNCHLLSDDELESKCQELHAAKEESKLVSKYECQRSTPLHHQNENLTDALSAVEEEAEILDRKEDYSRALAFCKAACSLKCLTKPVSSIQDIKGLPNIGDHSRDIIKEILENGFSREVERIKNDHSLQKKKMFMSIYGVGPSTARKWVDVLQLATIEDVINCPSINPRKEARLAYGIAFHEDLKQQVGRTTAMRIRDIVHNELKTLDGEVTVEVTGGFRRGKQFGHDVDLLISHPVEGRETGLLQKLIHRLNSKGLILHGVMEESTFSEEMLSKSSKLTPKGQLDHFEKWIGIMKFPKNLETTPQDSVRDRKETIKDEFKEEGKKRIKLDHSLTVTDHNHIGSGLQEQINKSFQKSSTSYSPSPASLPSSSDLSELVKLAQSEREWRASRVDLIIAPASQYAYALVGWTGSKMFNRSLRLYAQRELDMKLTSHGLFDMKQRKPIQASSEQEVFEILKLQYRDPEERNC
ncbi:DNA-directed DNA/RNA polymerase mu isoform X1 [Lingula anatina]|uniref:DNA-directed DNA polymerase n=1 Tax=Lingula anatina TaxID=7574 RepID=A0A1S3J3X7_LINAN|nr:DNA-directed DNA/RNA polymerase mu isoform X1 [Lingula anatina]|eukprot:XP_013405117.1 DNA-directed DNA/RNA polymerase mu isoform X1 [Lingula anatina]